MERYIQWGIPREKICYEDNGRNLPLPLTPDNEPPRPRNRLAFFGQLNPYKGIDLLLEAMKLLERQPFDESMRPLLNVHGANLEIQHNDFAQRIRSLLHDTQAHVAFHGEYKTSHLPEIMEEIDWVVVPSIWWENAPLVIQEAFRYGKPVICSDIGGMAEKVRDGIDGLHFQVSDAASLAKRIHHAVTTPGLWDSLHANIRPVHSIEHHVRNLSAIYDALSQGPATSPPTSADAADSFQSAISAKVTS
jgi:glycosyltransferase involved in cell wall biosynthesis